MVLIHAHSRTHDSLFSCQWNLTTHSFPKSTFPTLSNQTLPFFKIPSQILPNASKRFGYNGYLSLWKSFTLHPGFWTQATFFPNTCWYRPSIFFISSRNEYGRSISEILHISIVGLATKTPYLPSIACKKKGLVLIHKPKEGSLDMGNRLKMSRVLGDQNKERLIMFVTRIHLDHSKENLTLLKSENEIR